MTTIATASLTDAAEVVALWRGCGLTRPWNHPNEDFRRAIDWSGSTILVARDGEAIAGAVMVGYDGHRGWIYYLAVAPDWRRRGLGRSLMKAAEAWLAERGCPKVQLMVRDDNMTAIAFHEAIGLERQKVETLGRFLGEAQAPIVSLKPRRRKSQD